MEAAAQEHHSTGKADRDVPASLRLRVSASQLVARRQPFFYLMAALTTGITLDRWLGPPQLFVIFITLASALFSLKFITRKKDLPATVALLIAFTAAGALLSFNERTGVPPSRLKQLYSAGAITADAPAELTGVLAAPPEPALMERWVEARYLDVRAESVRVRGDSLQATGRARLLILLADEESKSAYEKLALDYGSRVRVMVRLERARSYLNPGSVDFNDFLERQGYDLKGVIKSPLLIESLGVEKVNRGLYFLYHLRLRLMDAIDSSFHQPVAGTLKAMLAGNRYFIDAETGERLREGATFHTLVISGFHVGIIAWALLRLRLDLRPRKARGREPRPGSQSTARVVIVTVALWAYTLMVGLAPPVTRATVMISVGLLGPLLFRQAASINTVSLAAFAMLALEPALVADPAFQLSFVAVAAIVGLAMPLILRLREIGEWRPSPGTPHPPSCSGWLRVFAETLFWDERAFREEMRRAPVRYRLEKARAARVLGLVRLQWLARGVVTLTITSLAIQAATLPLMAAYFNRAAPVGILLNIVAGLLTSILMLFALAAMTIGAALAPIYGLLGAVVNGAHYLLVNAVVPFTSIPGATFRVANYEGWPSIIYGLYFAPLVALAVLIDRWRSVGGGRRSVAGGQLSGKSEPVVCNLKMQDQRSPATNYRPLTTGRRPLLFCLLVLLAFVVAVIRPGAQAANGKLAVHFLDVGQGDSALIVFPQGATMLVDAGGDIKFGSRGPTDPAATVHGDEAETDFTDASFSIGESVVSRFLWSEGRTVIDYALVTHSHRDHIGGFSDVAKNFDIGQSIAGNVSAADDEFVGFAGSLARRGIPLAQVAAGEQFEIQGVTVEVLWPRRATNLSATSGNDDSVVLRLVYGSTSMLLAGDIEQDGEGALLRSGINLRSDVLKVPHHGSKTSSTEAFIDRVQPRVAVLSVGERSRFGHPHEAVINRYVARGVSLLQTGRDGMVTVETDGATLTVSTYRESKER